MSVKSPVLMPIFYLQLTFFFSHMFCAHDFILNEVSK